MGPPLDTLDTSAWQRVGGTPAGAYFELEPRILLALPNAGYVQDVGGARRSLEEFNRIARERGSPQVAVVLVDRVVSQDAAARRVWNREIDPRLMCGLVLVCSSLLARAIGSFFIGLSRPRTAISMVATLDQARRAARRMLAEHDEH
jgi:hypothetical protein